MRGRKPSFLSLAPLDCDRLHLIAHSDRLPWFQVRRARIVLAMAAGERKSAVAARMECGEATVWRTCERYRQEGLDGLLADGREGHSGRLQQITPVQRAQIVELACLEPIAKDLHITHWSSDDLARQAVADGVVAAISPATVRRLLQDVDLQPHRTRYWKTARLDARFKERAEQVLWCYGNASRLAEQGVWVVCVDEIPTFQVLEREPIRRAISGSIEQQEFDYTRHGTANMLVFLRRSYGIDGVGVFGEERLQALSARVGTFPSAPQGVARRLFNPRWRIEPHSRWHREVLCQERRLVETSLHTGQRFMAEPSGDPHSRLQALLPEACLMEDSGGVQNPCDGLVA
jgi:transposase